MRPKEPEREWEELKERFHRFISLPLHTAVACCDPIPGVPGLRRPPAKISARSLFEGFSDGEEIEIYDYIEEGYPWGFQSKELVSMCWEQCLVSGCQSYSVLKLDARTSLYFEHTENDADCLYLIAVSQGPSPQEAHKRFLLELLSQNGYSLDTGIMNSPPTMIDCPFSRRFLSECMLQAANYMGYSGFCDGLNEIETYTNGRVALPDVDNNTLEGRVRFIRAYVAAVKQGSRRRRRRVKAEAQTNGAKATTKPVRVKAPGGSYDRFRTVD